jgi:hypothetical protein
VGRSARDIIHVGHNGTCGISKRMREAAAPSSRPEASGCDAAGADELGPCEPRRRVAVMAAAVSSAEERILAEEARAMAAQAASGVETIGHLLERFPEDETTVHDLIRRDPTFAAPCEEYRQTEGELQQLRQRHQQIEDELLTRIEGYAPT